MGVAADTALSKIHSVLPELLHRQYVDKPEWLKVPRLHRDRSARHSDEIQSNSKKLNYFISVRMANTLSVLFGL